MKTMGCPNSFQFRKDVRTRYIFQIIVLKYNCNTSFRCFCFNQELELLYGKASDEDVTQSYLDAMANNGQMISFIKQVKLHLFE